MSQRIVPWETGIVARWYRANAFIRMTDSPFGIELVEEDTEQNWRLEFDSVQADRRTAEDEPWPFGIMNLPEEPGGFFEVLDSDWICELEQGRSEPLHEYRHFIVFEYDEIFEVVARACRVIKLDAVGYPDGNYRIQLDPSQVYQDSPPAGNDPLSKLLRLRLASRRKPKEG